MSHVKLIFNYNNYDNLSIKPPFLQHIIVHFLPTTQILIMITFFFLSLSHSFQTSFVLQNCCYLWYIFKIRKKVRNSCSIYGQKNVWLYPRKFKGGISPHGHLTITYWGHVIVPQMFLLLICSSHQAILFSMFCFSCGLESRMHFGYCAVLHGRVGILARLRVIEPFIFSLDAQVSTITRPLRRACIHNGV